MAAPPRRPPSSAGRCRHRLPPRPAGSGRGLLDLVPAAGCRIRRKNAISSNAVHGRPPLDSAAEVSEQLASSSSSSSSLPGRRRRTGRSSRAGSSAASERAPVRRSPTDAAERLANRKGRPISKNSTTDCEHGATVVTTAGQVWASRSARSLTPSCPAPNPPRSMRSTPGCAGRGRVPLSQLRVVLDRALISSTGGWVQTSPFPTSSTS